MSSKRRKKRRAGPPPQRRQVKKVEVSPGAFPWAVANLACMAVFVPLVWMSIARWKNSGFITVTALVGLVSSYVAFRTVVSIRRSALPAILFSAFVSGPVVVILGILSDRYLPGSLRYELIFVGTVVFATPFAVEYYFQALNPQRGIKANFWTAVVVVSIGAATFVLLIVSTKAIGINPLWGGIPVILLVNLFHWWWSKKYPKEIK